MSYATSNHLNASASLARLILKRDGRVMSPAGAYYRRDSLPHRFIPVGSGLVVPVGLNGIPCGFRPGKRDIYSVPHLTIREDRIARQFMILGEFLYVDQDALFDRSPTARRIYSVRSYLTLAGIGFPRPNFPSGPFVRICNELREEAGEGGAK